MWPIGTTGRGKQAESSPLHCIWESSGSNLWLGNGCHASYFSRFSSVLSGKCQDSTLNYLSIASVSFTILSCKCGWLLLHPITFKDTRTHSLCRTPLDQRSTRRRDLYLTTHYIHKRHVCLRRDSNPQFQQASDRRPMPQTARPPRSGNYNSTPCNPVY